MGLNLIIYRKYDGFELDEKNKAKKCPRCENEEIHSSFDHCKICGVNLVNTCAGIMDTDNNDNEYYKVDPCGTPAEGNARYCVKCGSPTTYFNQRLLKEWDTPPF
jgi:hypothetical protein